MTDFLKKTVDQRRGSFDVFETDLDQAWIEIDKRLQAGELEKHMPAKPKGWWNGTTRLAAAIALIGVASLVLLALRQQADKGQPTLSMVSTEMAETEQYYSMMISERLKEIQTNGRTIDLEVLADLEALDLAYGELRTDLADNVDNEEVIDAMIINYKIKLQILDRILAQIKEAKNGEDRKNTDL